MGCHFVGWAYLSLAEQAAWLQAIGSVLAIFVAIVLAEWGRRRDQRTRAMESARRGRSVALVVLPEVVRWKDGLKKLSDAISEHGLQHALADDQNLWGSLPFGVPIDVSEKIDGLPDLGAGGTSLQNAIYLSHSLRSREQEIMSKLRGADKDAVHSNALIERYTSDICRLDELVSKALDQLESLFQASAAQSDRECNELGSGNNTNKACKTFSFARHMGL